MVYQNTEFLSALRPAISLIRKGALKEGLEQLELIEGYDVIKNVTKAEVAYYKGSYKDAMYFDEHSLSSDGEWYDTFVTAHHLRAYVYAALQTGSVSRAKEFLDYYISVKRKEYDATGVRPFETVCRNAIRRLDGERAYDEPPKVKILTQETAKAQAVLPDNQTVHAVSVALNSMWNAVETEFVLGLYEKYADELTLDTHHIWAARNYIKLENSEKAEEALMRFVRLWKPAEEFQVLPMKVFVFKDLTEFLTPELKEKILKMPKT